MPLLAADRVTVSPEQRDTLERLVRSRSTPQQLALRARMLLHVADGMGVRATAREVGVWPKTVRYWCKRWRQVAEGQSVAERLADAPRSGAPATFTAEQICAVVALIALQGRHKVTNPSFVWSPACVASRTKANPACSPPRRPVRRSSASRIIASFSTSRPAMLGGSTRSRSGSPFWCENSFAVATSPPRSSCAPESSTSSPTSTQPWQSHSDGP